MRRPIEETLETQQETVGQNGSQSPSSVGPSPEDDIPLSDVSPNGAEGEGASGSAEICDSTEDSADSTGLTAQP